MDTCMPTVTLLDCCIFEEQMTQRTAEPKSAMTELITELDRTRKEFAKSAMHVTQLETQLQTARDDLVRKDQRIMALESDAASSTEQHRQLVNTLEISFQGKEMAWTHRMKTLEVEVNRLQSENAAMIQLERENRLLRDTILEHQAVMERLQSINDDLRNKVKEESRDQNTFLEAEFKKRLAESEKRFRAEAYRALSEEAKLALQGNDHLQTVLQRQNDSIEAVLLRCKTLEQAHAKIQDEQDANLSSINSHVAEIQRLKKQLTDAKQKGSMMDEAMKQRRVERASLELLFVEYETTRKQLAESRERCRRAVRESERWKSRAVQLTQELDDEQREAAESKLAAMQQQSDNIETHMERRKQREAKRARVRDSNAEGAQAMRHAEETWNDDGGSDGAAWDGLSDVEDDGEEGRGLRQRAVDPMEILAMWNVNFDSWKPPEGDEVSASSRAQVIVPKGNEKPLQQRSTVMESISDVPEGNVKQAPRPLLVGGSHDGTLLSSEPQLRSGERRSMLDAKLSVLSQPKTSVVPPGARYYAKAAPRKPLELQRQPMPPIQELNMVSKGEFKLAKRGGSGSTNDGRFLVP